MAREDHFSIIKKGVAVWNQWRKANPKVSPDLSEINLSGEDLTRVNFTYVNLYKANLIQANLSGASLGGAGLFGGDLREAILTGAKLTGANLIGADLRKSDLIESNLIRARLSSANLSEANLQDADLTEADLMEADLTRTNLRLARMPWTNLNRANLSYADLDGTYLDHAFLNETKLINANLTNAFFFEASLYYANLTGAQLIGTNLNGANLTNADLSHASLNKASLEKAILINTNFDGATIADCFVFGISTWGLNLNGTTQSNLIITPHGDDLSITVSNLEVAQFIYLLLYNEKIRQVIETITSKVVLILGRFTPDRKAVLNAIREELRRHDLLPVLFDFEKPSTRDTHETITTLARMARFVIADITDPKSIPQELVSIVEQLPSLPVQPILQVGNELWGMYDHIKNYPWVLTIHRYRELDELLRDLNDKVIAPAEAKAKELQNR